MLRAMPLILLSVLLAGWLAAEEPVIPPASAPTGQPPRPLSGPQLFAILDQVQNTVMTKKIPRDGTAKPADLAVEMQVVQNAIAHVDNPTGQAAQAGYLMYASMEAMCGEYGEAERQLRLLILHGTDQGPLAAYKELAEILLHQNRGQALDELADQAENAKAPPSLVNHIRMFANYLHIKIGEAFPLFSLTDTTGSTHTTSDFQGHILLLDFWAIWCRPCMNAIPESERIYSVYHPRGLDMIGISLDDNPRLLTEFIEKTHLTWPQVIQSQGFDSPLCQKYGVWGLPANFLISSTGILLAKNIHGTDLDQALKKLLPKP
jgi:peroxiredoxin